MARRQHDLYVSHSALVYRLFGIVPGIRGQAMEPCSGPGVMAGAIDACLGGRLCRTNAIDRTQPAHTHSDASVPDAACCQRSGIDWVITNPPFKRAMPILALAYEQARQGVAFLLRLSFAEPCGERAGWLAAHADQQVALAPVNPRPRYRRGEINPRTGKEYGTDSVTSAWFVWRKSWSWQRQGIVCPFRYEYGWRDATVAAG